jgi:hypothetical protein
VDNDKRSMLREIGSCKSDRMTQQIVIPRALDKVLIDTFQEAATLFSGTVGHVYL